MACRKAAHTYTVWVIIGPSDVTSKSKTDTNAGSTAASGFGNSVHGLVGHVEVSVTWSRRNAVVWERGLSRTRVEARAVVCAKAQT